MHATVAIPLARLRCPRAALLAATALQVGALTVVLLARPARAQSVAPTLLPTGGQVIGGSAAISRSGNTLSIDQSTTNAAINWQSFSVGSQAAVGFHVPTPQSTTINRIIGPDPSVIAGRLTSNGRVVIANQSGIVFANGAQVDVNALVASAPGITAANAIAGKLIFDQPARPGAGVVNNGNITIRQAGLAALVGPTVANNGVISARLGHVILQGAAAATLDFYGDGLLSFDVTKQVTKTPSGAAALVTNTGTIVAEGGTVTLSAAAVDGLVTNLVEAGGTIATPSMTARTGSIVIDGTGGSVTVVGQLAAEGTAPGTKGGTIAVNATKSVTVASGARLDASGQAGGGTVAVGTTAARADGGPSVKAPEAASTTIAQNATLAADAWTSGDGGHVTVLALGDTDFAGYAEARGGPAGGNGGQLEISGAQLQLTGGVDASAPNGVMGSLLLDPGNLKIISGGTDGVTNGETYTAASTSSIDPTALAGLTADITLSSEGHISIESAVSVDHGFTLFAASSIVVDASVDSTAGIEFGAGLTSLGAGGIIVNAPITSTGTAAGANGIVLTAGTNGINVSSSLSAQVVSLSTTGSIGVNAGVTSTGTSPGADSIVLSAGTNGIALNSNLSAPVVDLSVTGGGVTQDATAVITATILQSSNGIAAGNVWLIGTNAIDSLGSVAVTAGAFDLRDSHVLTLDGSVSFVGSPGTAGAGIALGGLVEGGGSLNGGTGLVSIAAFPTSNVLAIGTSGVTTVSLDPAALAAITAGTLELSGTGINVAATANLTAISTVDLEAGIGTITFSGGTFSATSLIADGAAITQAGGVLSASVLTAGTAGLSGVTLDGATNEIATISALGSLSGDLRILDGTALTLSGSNQATNVVLNDKASGTAITLGGTLSATSLDLSASAGSVVAQSGGTVTATTLASATGIGGSLDLSASSNTIATLGSLSATGGLLLVDATSVSVAGVVSVGSAETLSIADNGLGIAVGGSLSAPSGVVELGRVSNGGTVLLGAAGSAGEIAPGDLGAITAGTLRLGKTALEAGQVGTILSGGSIDAPTIGTLELDASGGVNLANGVTLAPGGALSGTMGHLSVTGTTNVIPILRSVNAGNGGITVDDGTPLTVAGTVAGGAVVLADSATGAAITVSGALAGNTSVELDASAGSVVGAGTITTPLLTSATLADGITLDGSANAITALGTLHATAGNVMVTDSSALSLDIGTSVSATAGNVVLNDGTTGTAIALNGGLVSASGTLDLSAPSGNVAQTGGVISAPTLASASGIGGSLDLTGGSNTIAALGSLTAGGTFSLVDTLTLPVTGVVRAGGMSLVAPGITLSGGSLISPGLILLDPEGAGASETGAGLISAGTLSLPSLAGTGAVTLTGNNTIATLGSVNATGAAVDIAAGSGSMNVTGRVSGTSVTLVAPTLSVSGAVLGTSLVNLDAIPGGMTLSGTVSSPLGVVALSATGGVSQTGGALTAATLETSSGIGGLLDLSGGNNTVGVLGALSANGGLRLVDVAPVTVVGSVSVGSGNTLSIADDGLAIATGGSLVAPGGVVELGPVDGGGTVLLGAAGLSTEIAPGSLGAITAATLRLGKTALETTQAGTIVSGGSIDAPTIGTLELDASGGVSLTGGVTLAGALSGTMGSLSVTGTANAIPILGTVNAGSGGITVDDATALAVAGSVTGGVVVLADSAAGTAITVSGALAGSTSVELDAPAGSVAGSASGTITTPLLTSATLADGIALNGSANAITTLGALHASAGNIVVVDGSALTLGAGTDVSASAGNVVLNDGATGTAIALNGGMVSASGTLDLSAANGSVTQTGGTLLAATLASGSGIGGSLDLTGGSNSIGALGALSATDGLKLVDTALVTVAGAVSVGNGNTLSIADNSLAMAVGGSLSAPGGLVELGPITSGGAVLLGAPGVAGEIAPGSLAAITAGTLRLGESGLEATEVGTILSGGPVTAFNVGTLELDATGDVTLANPVTLAATGVLSGTMADLAATAPGNMIPNLGNVNVGTGTINLDDAMLLSVPGSVSAGFVTLFADTLAVSGSIGAATQLNLLATPGGIGLTGTLASPTGVVNLTTTGSIQQSGGVIIAGTLASAFGAGGPVVLGSTQNTIGVLGGFSAIGQNISITDSTALVVMGPVEGATVTLDAPTLTVGGSVAGTSLVRLDAGAGGIALAGTLSVPTGVLDLQAPSGSVAQTSGAISAGTLLSGPGILGSLDLTGGSNAIGTLGSLAAASLSLADTQSLTVAGVVQASPISLQAPGISLAAGGSLLSVGAIVLNPMGGGLNEGAGGMISAGTLSLPNPTGAVSLTGANTIATLGAVNAAGATADIAVTSGTLNVVGPVVAASATLADTAAGQALTLAGPVDVTGTLDLASLGGVTQNGGTITAGTLAGAVTGDVALGGTNAIGVLGGFAVTSGTFALTDQQSLTVAGPVSATSVTLDAPTLAIAGSVAGTSLVNLEAGAGGLALTGTVSSPGGVVDISSVGTVAESGGAIIAGTLVSALGLNGSVDLGSAHNGIVFLGSLSAPGQLVVLANGAALTVIGPVSGTAVTLEAPTLSVTGTVSGSSLVSLDAGLGGLGLSGTVSSPGGVVEIASLGSVTQSGGAILAGTLMSGSGLGGPVDLGSTRNAIGILGVLSAPGQVVALTDGSALTVTGPVNAANLALTDNAGGTALAVGGSVTATGTLALVAPTGTVSLGGVVNAGVLEVSGEAVTQTGGTVTAGTLTNGGSLGSLTLIASSIGTLGPALVATGSIAVTDASLVTVTGVSAPSVTISDPAGIAVSGALSGTNGVRLASSAGAVGLTGTVTVDSGTLDVTASGGFSEGAGAVLHVPVLASSGGVGGGGVQLAGGRNTIATLGPITASGGITIADQAALTQTGLLQASSGSVVLGDAAGSGPALSLNGTILASGIVLSSTAAGITGNAIEQPATGVLAGLGGAATSLAVTAASGSIALLGAGNLVANLQGQAPSGAIALNDAAPLAITGALSARDAIALADTAGGTAIAVDAPVASATQVQLTAGSGAPGANLPAIILASAVTAPVVSLTSRNPGLSTAVIETGGGVITGGGTLTAAIASGDSNLGQGGNAIGTLQAFTAPGQTLILGNSAPMTISGPVSVGNFTLMTNQPVTVVGNLDVSNTWNIASSSDIEHVSGLLQAGTITGYAGHVADFGSGDLVGMLGPFAMSGSTLALSNAQSLVLQGPIIADYLAITAAGTITLRGNIQTLGLPIDQQTDTNPSAPGSYLSATGGNAAIIQVGQTMVTPLNGDQATLRLQLPLDAGGLISLTGLSGPQLNLILGLQGGGSATGTIAVASLTVIGGVGSATLNGTVGSFAGSIAAQNSNILPRPDGHYTLNNCPLKSVTCVVLPIAFVIPSNPLDELLVSIAPPQNDDLTILMPGIARKDY